MKHLLFLSAILVNLDMHMALTALFSWVLLNYSMKSFVIMQRCGRNEAMVNGK